MSVHNREISGTNMQQAYTIAAGQPGPKELTFGELWNIISRRRLTVAAVFLFFIIAGALVCILSTRRYEASAELQVDKDAPTAVGIPTVGEGAPISDALSDSITLQTQAGILQSDSLALVTIHNLNLEANQDFKPSFNPLGWILSFVTPDGPSDPKHATLEESPKRRMHALEVFHKYLKVKPVAGTRLIDVTYLNPDPVVAANVVNSISQGLFEFNFKIRRDATSNTAKWLSGQLSDLRRQSEDLQAKVAQAQANAGVLSLGGVDAQGHEQLYSAVLDKLQQATTAYAQAESNRIFKGAINEAAKTHDPEAIAGLSGNPIFASAGAAGAAGADSSLGIILALRTQLTGQQAQLAQLKAKFGPAYPKLPELESQIDAVQQAINKEVGRIAERAQNDYDVSLQVEDSVHKNFLEQKRKADALNDKAMAYIILRQEAMQSRTLYETLYGQMKQAGVLADFHSNNISIVDPARTPAKPARPKVLLYMLAAMGGGLLFGFCGAVIRDGMDRKIHSVADLEGALKQPVFGILPFHKTSRRQIADGGMNGSSGSRQMLLDGAKSENKRIIERRSNRRANEFPAVGDARSSYIEALRALRTSLTLSHGGAPPKVILVTSSIPGEGKSMLSLNLAALIAQQQKKVLLIDADLRRPILHRRLGVDGNDGLSSFLAGQAENPNGASAIIPSEKVPGLHLLPGGPVPPFPAELLGSEEMRNALEVWRGHFDTIIIDGSPVLPVTDSVILSTLADFTILLARHQVTKRHSLDRSYRILQAQGGSQVGIVLNAVRDKDGVYYEYYGSKGSKY